MNLDGFARMEANDLKCENIIINQDTLSRATLGGEAENLKAELSDNAKLYAFDLEIQNADVKAGDLSQAQVNAVKELQAAATDNATILYKGDMGDLKNKNYQNGRIERVEY